MASCDEVSYTLFYLFIYIYLFIYRGFAYCVIVRVSVVVSVG